MSYDKDKWERRLHNRTDMSSSLVHLTKRNGSPSNVHNLVKILEDRCIRGSEKSTGFIVGDSPAVCFQDAPLSGISQNVYHEGVYRKELGGKLRYSANGLCFYKLYIYRQGGRPCFYEQSEVAKKLLPPSDWWRIVDFDLSNSKKITDWTHEREWRVKGDFKFDLSAVTVILGHREQYREFTKMVDKSILEQLQGVVVLSQVL
ncbi:hypothetical protein [Paenibacillus durus]|uniref:DUF2971 domain-containing protein n=1 Tax=Paenibacillus durus TaxID=44251 RepID=A0A089HNS4_PAEDU|nr:hypothetical protein [Paenibacillus durus]AIQ13651.1 hypothetical protein PDUR_18325 [Paenibacillus durus]